MQLRCPQKGPSASQTSLLPANEVHIRQQHLNFWLRRTVLVAFSFLFTTGALALIGVSRYTTAQHGLPLSLSSSSYSWTYDPTGVLVIILALWRQVDYNCKSMQPWWEMTQRPSTAARSILLDYVSPFQPIVCASAFKNGHYAVLISTLSFLVLKLIILLSTTLFVIEPTWHSVPVSLRYQNTFNPNLMWNSPIDALSAVNTKVLRLSRQGDASIWSYMATLNNVTAKAHVDTKSVNMAYQSLSLPELPSNISSVSAIVDVFIPSVNCEEASASLPKITFTEKKSSLSYRFKSPSCSSGDLEAMDLDCSSSCHKIKRFFSVHWVDCAAHDNPDTRRSSEASKTDIRYAITIADLSTTIEKGRYKSNIERASSTICKVGYGMVSATSTQDTLSGQVTLNENTALGGSPRHLPNMTNHDLAEVLLANLNIASATLMVDSSIKNSSEYAFSLFQLLAAQLKSTKQNVDALLNPSLLSNLSAAAFGGIATEFAKKALLVKSSNGEPSEAVGHVAENRLHIRHYTLWPMVSGFFLNSLLCIVLSFIVPRGRNQLVVRGSIASYASVLANSPHFLTVLKGTGHYRNSQLMRILEDLKFTVIPSRKGPQIETFNSTREAPLPGTHSHRKKQPWLPLPARLSVVILCFVLPILTIVLLEILHRLSDRLNGLLDLDSSSSATLSYFVRLSSTLLAFIIATLFNNLDFSIAVFTPFSTLRSGSVLAQRSILFHLLGVSPFLTLVDTLRLRQFGSAASNLSTLLGSFLTIIVSGLWVVGDPVDTLSMSTATVQKWDTTWLTNNNDDQSAAITLNIIRHGGAPTPRSIQSYDVLPEISLEATAFVDRTSNTYETTVLRPVLECHSLPQEDILVTTSIDTRQEITTQSSGPDYDYVQITLNQNVSSSCSIDSNGRGDTGNLVANYKTIVGLRGSNRFGELLLEGIGIGQYLDLEATPGLSDAACPSTAIVFGELKRSNGEGSSLGNYLTALFCSQKIEEIPATITYKGNPSNINLGNIHLHTDKAKYWVNGTSNSTNMAFKLKRIFESGLTTFPRLKYLDVSTNDYYDKFFNHILFGPQAISPTDILGQANASALTETITHSFKEYFAHVIDLNFRSDDSETSIQGTSLQTKTRLAIHKVSKIILQSLLAATTIVSFVGYRLVKIRGTLPRNPCSIASTMGFLADSQLCDPKIGILPKDASVMTERELSQSLHGFVSSLGWWERSRNSNNSGSASPSREDSSDLDAGVQQEASENTYFGIDVGHTNALGFYKKQQ
ncbi:hypothetical protein K456DRAFT_28532 [Colletotrichum gloeosporioides 23]|nr:hypothetical protein K456DRAFT_28532 [Colletotrichum gloeosporioides 23]